MRDSYQEMGSVDAARLYRTLRGAFDAPRLSTAVRAQFPKDGPNAFDAAAFQLLYDDDFVRIPLNLADEIRGIIGLMGKAEASLQELRGLQSRIKTLEMQHRNAKREAERGLLKNRTKRLAEASRVEDLAAQLAQLRQRSLIATDAGQQLDRQRQRLLGEIEADPHLCDARWFGEQPVVVTHHGEFLAGYLNEINPTQLRGRTLAEVIKFGSQMS